jgi:hypothetical protein
MICENRYRGSQEHREIENDLVATGILGGTVPRGTRDCRSSLGDSPVAPCMLAQWVLGFQMRPRTSDWVGKTYHSIKQYVVIMGGIAHLVGCLQPSSQGHPVDRSPLGETDRAVAWSPVAIVHISRTVVWA